MSFYANMADHPLAATRAGFGTLLRDAQALGDLRFHLVALEAEPSSRYEDLNRKEKVAALYQDLADRTGLPESLDTLFEWLPEGPAGQLMRLYNHVIRADDEARDDGRTEAVTLGDTDERVTLEGMGEAALALNLSADAMKEDYHGEFSFDGSGAVEIQTFESEEANPDGYSPTGTYILTDTSEVRLGVAENTGFGGTIDAEAAETLEIEAAGLLSPTAAVKGDKLSSAELRLGEVGDDYYGHVLDLDATRLESLTIDTASPLMITSSGDMDALARLDVATDGFFRTSSVDLPHLAEATLHGAGSVELEGIGRDAESIAIDASGLRGENLPSVDPPIVAALNLSIDAPAGTGLGGAEIVGAETGANQVSVTGRNLTYIGGQSDDQLRYAQAGQADDLASIDIDSGLSGRDTLLMRDVMARGSIEGFTGDDSSLSLSGNSQVITDDFVMLTGSNSHPESDFGQVDIDGSGEVTLNDPQIGGTHSAAGFFSRETGASEWSVDDGEGFDGTFDFDVTVTSERSDTWDALLFEDEADDLFYVMDPDPEPGIEAGADSFRIAEVGEGWIDGDTIQTAAQVDTFIEENGLELLGVGETTLTDPYGMA